MLEPVFLSRSFLPRPQPWHRFAATRCTWSALGGPARATLAARVTSPLDLAELAGLLRCPLELLTPAGDRAWWGLVHAVTVTDGAAGLTVSLDALANRVRARYFEPNPNQFSGGSMLWTAWAEDRLSQSVYGIKESQLSAPAPDGTDPTDSIQAARLRDSILSNVTGPHGVPFLLSKPARALTIKLECRGWFDTLDWRFYEQPAGLVQNIPNVEALAQPVGTTAEIYTAQSFNSGAVAWRLDTLWIAVKKVGSFTDVIGCSLYSDLGDAPNLGAGSLATTNTISSTTLPVNFSWQNLTFTNPYTLAANTLYWLLFYRNGGSDNSNHFKVQVDESLSYTGGSLKSYNGSWNARVPDADLVFRASGSMANSTQIALTAANPGGGQFLAGIRWDATPTLYTNPYRPGLLTCKEELLKLLAAGNASGSLLAEVSPQRVLVIRQKPSSANPKYTLGSDGQIRLRGGSASHPGEGMKAPPGPGIAGEWAALNASWSNTPAGLALVPGRVFLAEVQWTPAGLTPLSAPS